MDKQRYDYPDISHKNNGRNMNYDIKETGESITDMPEITFENEGGGNY